MSTPTQINQEYDIIFAGGAPSSSPPSPSPLTEGMFYRWRCWLRRRGPPCGGRPGLAHPRTRGGSPDAQQPCAHAARALLVSPCPGFAHSTCACQPPQRGARKPLDARAMRTVSWRRRECQLYVSLSLSPYFAGQGGSRKGKEND
jgi:hypothetical protein